MGMMRESTLISRQIVEDKEQSLINQITQINSLKMFTTNINAYERERGGEGK